MSASTADHVTCEATWTGALGHPTAAWESISAPAGVNTTEWNITIRSRAANVRLDNLLRVPARFYFQDPVKGTAAGTGPPVGGCQLCLSSNNKGVLLSVRTSLVPVCVRQSRSYIPNQTASQNEKPWKRDTVRSVMWSSCCTVVFC